MLMRPLKFVPALATLCFSLSLSASAADRLLAKKPVRRDVPPFAVAAIVEEFRRASGDPNFAKVLAEPQPPPAPPPAEGGSDEATPDAGAPEDVTPPATDEAPPPAEEPTDDFDFGSKHPGAKKKSPPKDRPAPGSMEEFEANRQKQADQFRQRQTKQSRDFRAAYEEQRTKWFAAYQAMKDRWHEDRARFLKSIPQYKKNLAPVIGRKEPSLPKAARKSPPKDVSTDSFVLVNGGMEVPIRDQADRATCAAFAGVRALETVAKGMGRDFDLSEQFFYWLSKPNCQQSPCAEGGSWVTTAYAANLDAPDLVIPEESSCPYNPQALDGNDTQTPLAEQCSGAPVLRLSGVAAVYAAADVLRALDAGYPVVLATKLSENYFKSKGIVTQADTNEKTRDSIHADGHAYLAVGYMATPASMQATEGPYCILVANSWGEGWGAGGYACVTAAWFDAHRFEQDFFAPAEIMVR
jgi:C1A family cysteine protease